MRIRIHSRFALSFCAAALLTACGGSQPPIGVPGAIRQGPALAVRGDSTNYKIVYSFGGAPDAGDPVASLIDVGGTLYGTTAGGGSSSCSFDGGCGTVFSVTPDGTEKVLYRFRKRNTGSHPDAGLIDVDGTLYGTTSRSGSHGCGYSPAYWVCGTVFSITPSGTEKALHRFFDSGSGGGDGAEPEASLIEVKGKLYGTTELGGAYGYYCHYDGCGTVFSITLGGTEKVLHSFGKVMTDSAGPVASLIEAKGNLYGTTAGGGIYGGYGTAFSITLGGTEKLLHQFGNGADGSTPIASLIELDGALYGTTEDGGASNRGTVFSITPNGAEKVLHSFGARTDGSSPRASLIEVKGRLYGTTELGGKHGDGTVFSITPNGKEKVLYNFGSISGDGTRPSAGLIDVEGTLYGTTSIGGAHGAGTVFALTP